MLVAVCGRMRIWRRIALVWAWRGAGAGTRLLAWALLGWPWLAGA